MRMNIGLSPVDLRLQECAISLIVTRYLITLMEVRQKGTRRKQFTDEFPIDSRGKGLVIDPNEGTDEPGMSDPEDEVTEDFSCAFCLVQCASFKETNEQQAVNVFIKTDIWRPEIVAEELDPRGVTFCLCSKARKRRRSKNISQNSAHVHPHVLEPDSAEVPRESILGELKEKDAATHSFAMPTTASPMDSVNDGQPSKGREKTLKDFLKENDLQKGPENTYVSVSECIEHVISSPTITSQSSECNQSVFGSNLSPPAMLQFAKTRKLSAERTDPRKYVFLLILIKLELFSLATNFIFSSRMLLQKRQFFHSHRAQPMAMEQVFSERDSEDEVDDDIADFEDRRMLDDFVDVSKDEKQIMHLWNSFVRKQRVLADGHIPWACEAFSKLHGCDLGRAPALLRCWRLFMIKLWNHCLLDAQTIDNCNKILEKIQNESSEDNRQS
ncbi:hypothetical protein GIB67_012452 [Kingdonia uniflora]|uniref:Polycomb protein VEFS-Box domain-containing protein n=1 Tax=Kingdonia uniflora TaxID=39325 RepID=A0A7J7MV48_9MAGN|nr:hypothetical protein GIB67_012452 [Kingdonia uniflora]